MAATATASGQRPHLTNPLLLSSSKLTSKYVSTDKKLESHGGSVVSSLSQTQSSVLSRGLSSQLSQTQGSGLSSQLSQTQDSVLSRTLSHKSDKAGPLSSSSGSSLTATTSSSELHSTKPQATLTTTGSQLLRKDLTSAGRGLTSTSRGLTSGLTSRGKLSGTSTDLRPSLHTKSELLTSGTTQSQPLLSHALAAKSSVSVKSAMALTSFATPSGPSSFLSKSTAPLTGQTRGLGRSDLLTFTSSRKPDHASSVSSASLKFLTTSTVKTSASLLTGQLAGKKSFIETRSKESPILLSSKTKPTASTLRSSKPLTSLAPFNTKPSKMLSSHATLPRSQLMLSARPSLKTASPALTTAPTSRQLQGKLGTQDSSAKEPVSVDSILTQTVTENTEGAPKYDFSSEHTKTTSKKRKLFVSPELDASVQAPPPPAVDVSGLKVTLLNAVATSLLCSPDFHTPRDPTHQALSQLGEKLSHHDPEFILKLALYTRVNLNIRTTANFLLALAAKLPPCRPYLRKYFSAAVKLPSDWIEVAEIYQAFQDDQIKSGAIPTALRKVMGSKFMEFDTYQLGKYNKDSSKKKKNKTPSKAEREKQKAEKSEQERKKTYMTDFPRLNDSGSGSDSESDSDVVLSESESKQEIERLSFTLKQLIRKIHISEPVEHVMCLVGKKYPEDPEEFRKSRLPGTWDQDRAGKRMKLPTPETWETQVSTKGNKAGTWEQLIDNKKLPFMAMLRNIRNLILAGVSGKHHQWVIKKLNDEYAVVNSKQFPFRFFSAYEVLDELGKVARGERPLTRPQKPGAKKKKPPKETPQIDTGLLERYKAALDSALKIATCYNVKPIAGSTLILCNVGSNMDRPCTAARGLGKPRKVVEVGVLLGLMCKYSCEHSTMLLYGQKNFEEVSLKEGTILHNMEGVMKRADVLSAGEGKVPVAFLQEMLVQHRPVDNLVLLTDAMKLDDQQGRDVMDFLRKYRHLVNPDLLFVSVDLSGRSSGVSSTITPEHPNDIYLAGYSDQILRFIAERGDSGQLTYVENIDKITNLTEIKLPSLAETAAAAGETGTLPDLSREKALLSATQGQHWRTVRIFISSTFRDMHGERDLLTRFVFPELRARAHSRQIHVYEVDLRWGVTEQDARSHKALEICLEEISRSQYFIGLLGQRYGWIQEEYEVPDQPEFDWLKEIPPGKSITEIEMYHAALRDTDKAVDKAFFYFRNPSFLDKVPQRFRADFESESEEAREKIEALKSDIITSGLEVYNDYPCYWLGEVQSKPMVGGLESFGQRVLHSLWNAIQRDHPEGEMDHDLVSQAAAQHASFQDSRASTFIGRRALLQKAQEAVESSGNKLVVVTGKPGCGKSAFMAAIAQEHTARSHARLSVDLAIPHFIGAAPGSANIASLLTRLCHELKRRFGVSRDIPDDYTDLVREWQGFLEDSITNLGKVNTKILIVIDGVDLLEDKHNGRSLDWIPEEIPEGVVLLLSGVEGGSGVTRLRKRKQPPVEIVVGALDMFDKAEMVRKKLQKYRKTLEESPFNNQMKLLLTKKEATNPLFLHLACEELRVFGVFEEVTGFLKKLPSTVSNMLQEILQRLESEHSTEILSTAMILLTQVRSGLLEYEMTRVLELALNELYPDREGQGSLPPMTVSKLLRSLQTFLQPTGQEAQDRLTLAHKDIEKAVKLRYTRGAASKKEGDLHRLLATFFQAEADPDGDSTFRGNSARAFTELPYHLMEAGAWKELEALLCNINFVLAKCRLGLAQQLLEDYSPVSTGLTAAKSRELSKLINHPTLQEYKSFVSRNLHILLKTPSLALQQALNEPRSSNIATASQGVHQEGSMMVWVNKPDVVDPCQMNITSQTGPVLCVAVSPNSTFFAAGYKNGAVRVYEVATGKEVHTFIGHAAGVNDVCFLGDSSVCSASHDTNLSIWDTAKGIRLATLRGHTRGVHGCAADKAGKTIVSVSWDTSVKVWAGKSGKLQGTLKTIGQRNTPLNCVSFHPEGQLVVVGSWDSTLRIWDTLNLKKVKILRGHKSSVQACAYAPSGRHVVSAALDGEVKVWSTRSGTAVGSIIGHHSPVKGLAFTPNGQFLATASSDKTVKVWSGTLGQPIRSMGAPELGFVHRVVFNHETQSVSVGYHDGHIRQFSVQTGAELAAAVRLHSSPVMGLAHHGNLHMAAFADGTIKVCDLSSPQTSVDLRGHSSPISYATWGRKGFASASEDFCILMWDYDLQTYTRLLQPKSAGHASRMSKKKRAKATPRPSNEGGEKELVVNPLVTLRSEHTGKITAISFSCDGLKMAASSHDRSISIWNCMSRKMERVLQDCHKDWVTTCCFSDTSANLLVTGSTDFTLKVWNVSTGREKTTFRGHTSAINSVVLSQGCVVSGAHDGSVKVWTQKGVEITTLHCHRQRVNACLLHVPGTAVATNVAASWADIEEEEEEERDKLKLDKILVLTGSDDGTVSVWKPFLPNEITSLVGHSDQVLSVDATLNNQLITASRDGNIRVWQPTLPSSPGLGGHLALSSSTRGHTGAVTSLVADSVSGDIVCALSGGRDGYIRAWKMTAESVSQQHQMSHSNTSVTALCLTTAHTTSQSAGFVAGGDDGSVTWYGSVTWLDSDKGVLPKQQTNFSVNTGQPISKLAPGSQQNQVLAASWSKDISVLDVAQKTARKIGQHRDWVVDVLMEDRKTFSLGLDGFLYCWSSLDSPPTKITLKVKAEDEKGIVWPLSLCAVPGTKYLVISDSGGKVHLCNKVTKSMVLTKKLHGKQINVVCPVGYSCFMTGSDDCTVKVWQVDREEVTQVGQFHCQACVTALSPVRSAGKKTDKNSKPMFVVGDSLGNVSLLQWQLTR